MYKWYRLVVIIALTSSVAGSLLVGLVGVGHAQVCESRDEACNKKGIEKFWNEFHEKEEREERVREQKYQEYLKREESERSAREDLERNKARETRAKYDEMYRKLEVSYYKKKVEFADRVVTARDSGVSMLSVLRDLQQKRTAWNDVADDFSMAIVNSVYSAGIPREQVRDFVETWCISVTNFHPRW